MPQGAPFPKWASSDYVSHCLPSPSSPAFSSIGISLESNLPTVPVVTQSAESEKTSAVGSWISKNITRGLAVKDMGSLYIEAQCTRFIHWGWGMGGFLSPACTLSNLDCWLPTACLHACLIVPNHFCLPA